MTILVGDAPVLGKHLFGQGYSLAAAIANEFGEAQELHRSALFAAGLVLFVLTLLVNITARLLVMRAERSTKPKRTAADFAETNAPLGAGWAHEPLPHNRLPGCLPYGWRQGKLRMSASAHTLDRFAVSARRRRKDRFARGSVVAATVIALVPLVLIVYYLLSKGLGSWSIDFFTTDPTGNTFFASSSIGGIKSAILGTIEIVAVASVFAIPSAWAWRCGSWSMGAAAASPTPCASSWTCSRACLRSCLACSSTSR